MYKVGGKRRIQEQVDCLYLETINHQFKVQLGFLYIEEKNCLVKSFYVNCYCLGRCYFILVTHGSVSFFGNILFDRYLPCYGLVVMAMIMKVYKVLFFHKTTGCNCPSTIIMSVGGTISISWIVRKWQLLRVFFLNYL